MTESSARPSARTVTFRNREGLTLVGVVHEPVDPRSDVAVVLLSAGVKARVGPHGLYTYLADALCRRGFRVLRFDFAGLGDSEGSVEDALTADYYGSVSLGRYVPDTHTAVDWACRELGVERVLLAGLCGGAITGLIAGATHPHVAGLLALGLPVSVDGSDVDRVRFMSAGQLESVRDRYIDKIKDPRAWLRVLGLKTDFRLLARSFLAPRRAAVAPDPTSTPAAGPPDDNTNPHFLPAMLAMLGDRKPVMMIFSGADRLYWEFEERMVDSGRLPVEKYHDVLDVEVVDGANHVFGFKEWQDDMLERATRWLGRRFPVAVSHGRGARVATRRVD